MIVLRFRDILRTCIYIFCKIYTQTYFSFSSGRGEAAKLAHLIESASLKRKYMTKNYEKIFM